MKICKQYCNSLTELVFFWRVSDISRHFVTNSWHDGQFLTSSWPIPDVFGQNLVIFWRIPDELVKTWREMTSIWRQKKTSEFRQKMTSNGRQKDVIYVVVRKWRPFDVILTKNACWDVSVSVRWIVLYRHIINGLVVALAIRRPHVLTANGFWRIRQWGI